MARAQRTPYAPNSPYAASKAASDHLVRAYHHTFGLPVTTSNCSNNYGPFQFPEKLIPLMLVNALQGKPLPIYGDGGNVRDWLYVIDHCRAVERVLLDGRVGETYNVGGRNEWRNVDVVRLLCQLLDRAFAEDASLGLKDGDVIVAIGGREPQNGRHAMRILRSYQPGESVDLKLLRDRKPQALSVKIPERSGREFRRPAPPPRPPVPPEPPVPPSASNS